MVGLYSVSRNAASMNLSAKLGTVARFADSDDFSAKGMAFDLANSASGTVSTARS